MSKPTVKLVVCTEGKKCCKRGSKRVFRRLEEEIERGGHGSTIKLKESDCLKLCKTGPTLVVKPDGPSYGNVDESDCAEIVSVHAATPNAAIDRLQVKDKKRKNK
jgi:(2Fe-2S) ferredoxin